MDVLASVFVEYRTKEELQEIFRQRTPNNWFVLGGGSNVLFTRNYDGWVLHPVGDTISVVDSDADSVLINAEAGCVWDDFVAYCVDKGYCGAENLSYIPGSVGAAPVQNVGAYGVEAKDIIESVECYFPDEDRFEVLSAAECEFAYRHSIFKTALKGRAVVVSVNFRLSTHFHPILSYGNITDSIGDPAQLTLRKLRDAIVRIRKEKLPDPCEIGSGGSFFKNPVVLPAVFEALKERYPAMPHYPEKGGVKIPAGWLIDTAGWKGYRKGDAGVHARQALVLVNYGGAAPAEIVALSDAVTADVRTKFGIELSPEIIFL